MIPVDQTIFGAPEGNCLPACIASILHLAVEDVPCVCNPPDGDWLARLATWLRGRGFRPLLLSGPPGEHLEGVLCVVSGKSPRGDYLHATVWRGGHLVHDPHPSRAGIDNVSDTLILVPLDPRPLWSLLAADRREVSCG